MLITREFIYMKKPRCCWRNQEASTVLSCHCLPVWRVKSGHSQDTQINVCRLLCAACTTQTGARRPCQSHTNSFTGRPATFALPPPGLLLAVLRDWTSLSQEADKHIQGSGSKFGVVPTLPRQRTPTHWAGNRSALPHPFSGFLFPAFVSILRPTLWGSEQEPSEEDPQCHVTPSLLTGTSVKMNSLHAPFSFHAVV